MKRNGLEPRVVAVYATHGSYLQRAKDNARAAVEVLKNMEELMVASVDFQCFLNTSLPIHLQYDAGDDGDDDGMIFNTTIADYKFVVKDDGSRKIECGLINLNGNTIYHHMSAKFMTDMNKAVKDPSTAAAMITLSNKDFYKRYRKPMYANGEELYALYKYLLTKILTT